jgi:hypothetical protein
VLLKAAMDLSNMHKATLSMVTDLRSNTVLLKAAINSNIMLILSTATVDLRLNSRDTVLLIGTKPKEGGICVGGFGMKGVRYFDSLDAHMGKERKKGLRCLG